MLTKHDRPTTSDWAFVSTYFLPTLIRVGSPGFRRFLVNLMPWKSIRELRNISDVLYETSVEIFESKKAALEAGDSALKQQVGEGKDILSILSKRLGCN